MPLVAGEESIESILARLGERQAVAWERIATALERLIVQPAPKKSRRTKRKARR